MRFDHELRHLNAFMELVQVEYTPVHVFEYENSLVNKGQASELAEHKRMGEPLRITPDDFTSGADIPSMDAEVKTYGATLVHINDGETATQAVKRWARTVKATRFWFVEWVDGADTMRVYSMTKWELYTLATQFGRTDTDTKRGGYKVRLPQKVSKVVSWMGEWKERDFDGANLRSGKRKPF